jgi:hypothetical protein
MSARRLAKKPHLVRVIMNYRLALMAGKSREIELLATGSDELSLTTHRNGDAHVIKTCALRFQFPPCGFLQFGEREPQVVIISARIGHRRWMVSIKYDYRHTDLLVAEMRTNGIVRCRARISNIFACSALSRSSACEPPHHVTKSDRYPLHSPLALLAHVPYRSSLS